MALDKAVDSAQLNADLTAVADAIRTKGGTSAQLAFPDGFVSAVQAIEGAPDLQIVVTTSAGATVTATKGSKTASGTADASGNCTLIVDEVGTWTVTAATASTTKTADVVVGTANVDLAMIDPVFGNNSWAAIIKACQEKQVPNTWNVGDSCNMTINNKTYAIDIIGKNHDDYADGSGKAPLTFQLHNSYGTAYAMKSTSTNAGGWKECAMRKTHLPAVLALMPAEVQSGICEVSKTTAAGGSGSSWVETVTDKLFLLSEVETFGSTGNSAAGEGSQYAYYETGGSAVKTLNGEMSSWWLRSPMRTSDYSFCASSGGGEPTHLDATAERGTAFAFCF